MTPRPAATIALVRDGEAGPEVFLVRRHARSGFMANAYVFPGGRLDEADAAESLIARLGPSADAMVDRMAGLGTRAAGLAHVIAALRETFEESGILLGRHATEDAFVPEVAWQQALNTGERSFESILEDEALILSTEGLAYFAHWITPTFESRRYDTRFFLAVAPSEQEGGHDGRETTESLWISPTLALERHAAGELFVAPPQWQVLRDLRAFVSTDEMLAWAREGERVAPIQPHRFELDGTLALALPGDPEHPDTAGAGAQRRIVLREGTWRDG